jgi:hypothetical protein
MSRPIETNYTKFTPLGENLSIVRAQFKSALETSEDPVCLQLLSALQREKQLKIKIGQFTDDNKVVHYLIMITCFIDRVLVNLGKSQGFPRGFPIIWVPDHSIQFHGFYPKFANDLKGQTSDADKTFDGLLSISFFKKWSGFLGQVMAFKDTTGIARWTFVSKNSFDPTSKFVIDGACLFAPYMTSRLVDEMINRHIHICAEMISKEDQTHGSYVEFETPIVTCVGTGHCHLFGKTGNPRPYVEYKSPSEIALFCLIYDLPCDTAIEFNDTACAPFIKKLSENRDFMTNDMFNDIIRTSGVLDVTVVTGSVTHKKVYGQGPLEGLVLKLEYKDGRKETIKYKFPKYTVLTMFLRANIDNSGVMNPRTARQQAKRFVNHWCVSDAGKKYWYEFAMKCARLARDGKMVYHLRVAELVSAGEMEGVDIEDICSDIPSVTVIIAIGPIGSGKSTGSKAFALFDPDRFVHLDGDRMDLNPDMITKFGWQRNEYSIWCIIKVILSGKIPIISCGGGILFDRTGNNFILGDKIEKILNVSLKTVIIMPMHNIDEVIIDPKNLKVEPMYENAELVQASIIDRVERGAWAVPKKFNTTAQFAQYIAKRSYVNVKFANALIQDESVYCVAIFPMITPKDHYQDELFAFNFDKVIKLIPPQPEVKVGNFTRINIMMLINHKIGHVTYEYSAEQAIEYSHENFVSLLSMYPEHITGNSYTLYSKENANSIQIALPDKAIHGDGSTHITLNPGCHLPVHMRTVALAIVNKEKTVSIPDKTGKMIEYYTTTVPKPISIQVLSTCGY